MVESVYTLNLGFSDEDLASSSLACSRGGWKEKGKGIGNRERLPTDHGWENRERWKRENTSEKGRFEEVIEEGEEEEPGDRWEEVRARMEGEEREEVRGDGIYEGEGGEPQGEEGEG